MFQNAAHPLATIGHRWLVCVLAVMICLVLTAKHSHAQKGAEEPTFGIEGFLVEGNSLLDEEDIQDSLEPITGQGRTATDVEKARDALEQLYHKKGYPTVLVNIPEQTVDEGIIRLEVIEGRIEKVNVTGNKYYTMEKIKKSLPSFSPGEVIYAPEAQKEIGKLNDNPDIKVTPAIIPGKVPGAVDIELKVDDKAPVHGNLEISNRASPNTTDLRMNAVVHYDNLWQLDHSATLQYQLSPQSPEEVEVVSATYVMPAPWNADHHIAVYGVWSNGNTGFGEGLRTIGKGSVFGLRYVLPLPAFKQYGHNITLGMDYKHFTETDPSELTTPVTYFPLSVAYSSVLTDSLGATQFNTGLNMSFRGLVADQNEFSAKRYGGEGSYLIATAGVERTQELPAGMKLYAKIEGQISSEPLISNEQISAGGMESVRGYKETEILGDHGVHGTFEFRSMDLFERYGIGGGRIKLMPYIFFDFANLFVESPLPGQKGSLAVQGTGFGMRGLFLRSLEYDTAWGVALSGTDNTSPGDSRLHFKMRYLF